MTQKKLRFRINNLEKAERNVISMTEIRQEAIELSVKLLKDKLMFIIQIIQDVKGLYGDNKSEKKEAFSKLEGLKKKGTVTDYDMELVSYKESKAVSSDVDKKKQ